MKFLTLCLSFLILSNCLAADVTFIEKGTPAPYSGHLFTEKKAQSVRKELIEKDQLSIFNKALLENEKRHNKIIANQNEQVVILKQHVTKLSEMAETTNTEKALWFGLGVVAAGLSVYGAAQLIK